ncbi:MAG: ATP-dependent protease ATPase subunit HslU [Thermomicrobiales bacterium]
MTSMTPTQIVAELDRYIIGQDDAKRMVSVALRNRWRRQQLSDEMRSEVHPSNILMIGPTGVGKTEIARRVARIVNAPFIKVEATKFTEVGYVGRDVESIVRDLVEAAISLQHNERLEAVREQAAGAAAQRLVELLVIQLGRKTGGKSNGQVDERVLSPAEEALTPAEKRRISRRRKQLTEMLDREALEDETIEIDVESDFDGYMQPVEIVSGVSPEELHDSVRELIDAFSPRRQQRRVSVREARRILTQQEATRLVDMDAVVESAIKRCEETGVVFIDEIDKTIHSGSDYGPDVSGEGVQRDLLPIVEGSVVMTRYGPVRTDHVLFIAAGSFSSSRPSDLIPELQGRFPLRVELDSLDEDDMYAILTVPANALTRQATALLASEGVELRFEEDGLREIAAIATDVNARTEDIGARRLLTVVERVLEEISFDAPERNGETIVIDATYVDERIGDIASDEDLNNAIL